MSLSFLIFGDLHFRSNTPPLTLQDFMSFSYDVTSTSSPNHIIILGDVLHTHQDLESYSLNIAQTFITKLSELITGNVYVLVGNHDMYNNQQFLNTNHWMNCLKPIPRVVVIDKDYSTELEGYKILMAPYVPPGMLEKALENHYVHEHNLVLLHQEMRGCKMGAIVSEQGDEWYDNYPPIVSGHIHNRQYVGTNIYYPGSVMQHAFGESSDKGLLLLILSKEEMKNEELFPKFGGVYYYGTTIQHEIGMKKIIYSSFEDLKDVVIPVDTKYEIKICVKDEVGINQFKAFRKSKLYENFKKRGVKIVFKQKKAEKVEVEHSNSFQEVFMGLLQEDEKKFLTEHIQ
jgi:DNA repair exonuclease SbcCD nuclease subunit